MSASRRWTIPTIMAASGAMPAESVEISERDVHEPDLRIGNPLAKALDGLHLVLVEVVLAGLDVESDELVLVRSGQVWTNLGFDQRVSSAGEFFLGVTSFVGNHAVSPADEAEVLYRLPRSGR